jgi:ligand-binding sensor domain-containing protein
MKLKCLWSLCVDGLQCCVFTEFPRQVSSFLLGFLFTINLYAQTDIPLGTWRMHLSYNSIHHISMGDNKIFGAAESGILILDKEDNSLFTYNTLNGLSATGISHIAFDEVNYQLLVAYADGNFDIIQNEEVSNFNRLKNSADITGSRKINHIAVNNNMAYLSADFGVVVFDLQQQELKETWRNLGAAGAPLKIFQSTFKGDSIFLATEKGIMAGSLNDNLLYFNNWTRFDSGDFGNPVQALTLFNNKVYAAVNGFGIYRYENLTWTKETFFGGATFKTLSSSSDNLFILEDTSLWKVNSSGTVTAIENPLITLPFDIETDVQGNLWIGDFRNGLVSGINGNFNSYLPDGPTHTAVSRLTFKDNRMFALQGKPAATVNEMGDNRLVDFFVNGAWETLSTDMENVTDVDLTSNYLFLSSYGYGLEQTDNEGNKFIVDNTNSPLVNTIPAEKSVYVTALASFQDELWMTNYGAETPLHVLQNGSWQSFSFSVGAGRYPTDISVDVNGNVWMILDPAQGGGILIRQRQSGNIIYKSEVAGTGALPSRNVRSTSIDRDGYIWVGTDQGVAYFFSEERDAIKPIFENRFLLRDEKITAIQVDGGNRKWIGTERGVWLFNPSGEELIHNFNVENSPLLSNTIRDIEINNQTGEVFFSTDKGIISYRSDATGSDRTFTTLKIFPNPVTSDFAGMVAISGLATDAIVKITDISGKLIWQAQANGGTATWNVRDYNGRRAATGIYLVFAATADGSESAVGKIAVVD